MTTLCSWSVCFSPPIYAHASEPLDILTLATFLCAELGFFGVMIVTLRQTPLLNGECISTFLLWLSLLREYCSAGDLDLTVLFFLEVLTSCWIVGMRKIMNDKLWISWVQCGDVYGKGRTIARDFYIDYTIFSSMIMSEPSSFFISCIISVIDLNNDLIYGYHALTNTIFMTTNAIKKYVFSVYSIGL